MKQPKRLSRDLKIAVSSYNLNPQKWMLSKDDGGTYVIIIHKESGNTKIIDRYARPNKGGQK